MFLKVLESYQGKEIEEVKILEGKKAQKSKSNSILIFPLKAISNSKIVKGKEWKKTGRKFRRRLPKR